MDCISKNVPEVSFTELRSRAKFYFDAVESGASVLCFVMVGQLPK